MVKLWILLGTLTYFSIDVISLTKSAIAQIIPVNEAAVPSAMDQVTSVSQLADVQPSDWAFQALQSLVERYGCIAGYSNQRFQGDRALTRNEFAAGVNACLGKVAELAASRVNNLVTREDLLTLQQLQEAFAAELATIRGQVEMLAARTTTLEANQFSTTTKLNGEVIFAVNAGGFNGDRIIDPTGVELADRNPNPTVLYRAALILNTSFTGTDQLRILLDTGSNGARDNATGVLEPNFGSVLDFSVKPPTNGEFGLSRVFYTFQPFQDFTVSIGPNIRITDYIDRNSYANLSNRDFSTLAFVNNYILVPIFGPSAGAAIEWNPGAGALTLRALYAASDPANPGQDGPSTGVSLFANVLYPAPPSSTPAAPDAPPAAPRSDRGFFGDTYQGLIEVEYAPSKAFKLRLQYSGGELFDQRFDVVGANVELALAPQVALFGRYGYGSYSDTAFGDINPSYWMAGIAFPDLFTKGALAGVAVGQPLIVSEIGNGTQTNVEAFYRLPLTDNIQLTPLIQVVFDPSNQSSNGTIVTGTVRTVFSF